MSSISGKWRCLCSDRKRLGRECNLFAQWSTFSRTSTSFMQIDLYYLGHVSQYIPIEIQPSSFSHWLIFFLIVHWRVFWTVNNVSRVIRIKVVFVYYAPWGLTAAGSRGRRRCWGQTRLWGQQSDNLIVTSTIDGVRRWNLVKSSALKLRRFSIMWPSFVIKRLLKMMWKACVVKSCSLVPCELYERELVEAVTELKWEGMKRVLLASRRLMSGYCCHFPVHRSMLWRI